MNVKQFVMLTLACLFPWIGQAAPAPEEQLPATPTAGAQFNYAHKILKLADLARNSGEVDRAGVLYGEARQEYVTLSKNYPDWQPGITDFQIRYCDQQLKALGLPLPPSTPESPSAAAPDAAAAAAPLPPPAPPPAAHAAPRDTTPAAAATSTAPAPEAEAPTAVRMTAEARQQIGDADFIAARATLIKALTLAPDDRTIRQLLALTQCQSENYEDALFILDVLIEEDGKDAMAHLLRATAALGLGQTKEAMDDLQVALTLEPKFAAAHYNLARLLISEQQDLKQARQHYDQAIQNGGEHDPEMEALLRN